MRLIPNTRRALAIDARHDGRGYIRALVPVAMGDGGLRRQLLDVEAGVASTCVRVRAVRRRRAGVVPVAARKALPK
jgi:hypothetical protein